MCNEEILGRDISCVQPLYITQKHKQRHTHIHTHTHTHTDTQIYTQHADALEKENLIYVGERIFQTIEQKSMVCCFYRMY